MKSVRSFACLLAALSGTAAFGQIGGTVYVDFAGFNGTPQGNITALSTAQFPGLVPADLANLRTAIYNGIVTAYSGFSINITNILPAGNFTRLVIGDSGSNAQGALGIADQIDFRNMRNTNIVSVVANIHFIFPPTSSNLAGYGNLMANTAAHELGHVLGLVHSDPVSTFVAAGGGAAGRTAVQTNEIMRANTFLYNSPGAQPQYNAVGFGAYSRKKLTIATQGVNVQVENAAASMVFPAGTDPVRAGDAGSTMATARVMNFDTNDNDVALGSLNNDTDIFKFTVPANTRVSAEIFSKILNLGNANDRITNPIDSVLEILDSAGTVIMTQQFDQQSNFDGATVGATAVLKANFGSDSLIYNFLLANAGEYGVRVSGGADKVGDYELYVTIPAPGSPALVMGGLIVAARRRRSV